MTSGSMPMPNADALILTLDQSTSATKAWLCDLRGEVVDQASKEHRQFYPCPGWVEHDAEEIWQNTLVVLGSIIGRHHDKLSRLLCLSVTNQRETVVVFERSTGRPLHPAIVWQCRRGAAICEALTAAGHEPMVRQKTGLRLDTYFSASKLTWLVRQRPDIRSMLERGDALIGTIDAYLLYRLTRRAVFATDTTNASRTLLFDIHALRWDPGLCDLFEVPITALPQVRDSTAIFGATDLEGLLPRAMPICGVMGDSQASLFAQRCYERGDVKVTFGSGSSMLMNIGDQPPTVDREAMLALAWTHEGRPTYCLEGVINHTGATIAWLRDQLGLIQSARETEQLATAVPDNGGVYLVPAFAGLSEPYWCPQARAAIVGLTAHSNRSHIVRAALEAIAYQIRDVLDVMQHKANVPIRIVYGDGAPTANAFLMQFTADLTGVPWQVPDAPGGSALGAALAGALGMKAYSSLHEIANLPRACTDYQPSMPNAMADHFYAGWSRAVDQVLHDPQAATAANAAPTSRPTCM
jgi:glycerol kinase